MSKEILWPGRLIPQVSNLYVVSKTTPNSLQCVLALHTVWLRQTVCSANTHCRLLRSFYHHNDSLCLTHVHSSIFKMHSQNQECLFAPTHFGFWKLEFGISILKNEHATLEVFWSTNT